MILALLLAFHAQAATLTEKWSASFKEGAPVAAFFDAQSGSVFVSVDEGNGARVDKFNLTGKLLKEGIAKANGSAGPLRAHFGKVYWLGGETLYRFDPEKGKPEKIAEIPGKLGRASDLTVARNGTVYVGMSSGTLLAVQGSKAVSVAEGKAITGLFLLDEVLYLLRTTDLESFPLNGKKVRLSRPLCKVSCLGLEKNSAGAWLTGEGNLLREFSDKANRVLLEAKETIGRMGYVYNVDPKEDLVVLPLPAAKIIRAYRLQ